ncbi:MAG: DUF177 domain-containing protein [Sphingomonadaceae bacterium]
MDSPEFSFLIAPDRLTATASPYDLVAGEAAREALAKRFDLLSLDRLEAHLLVRRMARGVEVNGHLEADAVQACVISGAPVPAHISAPVHLRFERMTEAGGEMELDAGELDILPIGPEGIDLGEAIAESLALELPEWPRADDETVAAARGLLMSEEQADAQIRADRMAQSPFAGLKRSE